MTAAEDARDGWSPEFDGQRPPFTEGNAANRVHGARREAEIAPLAAQIATELLSDPDTPAHLHEPLFTSAVEAWSRAEAVVRLLWAYISGQDVMDALTDLTTAVEDEEASQGRTHRKSVTRHVPAALERLRKYETLAASLRGKLGLDPISAARIGRDLAARRYMDAAPLAAALAEIEQNRALTAGGADG